MRLLVTALLTILLSINFTPQIYTEMQCSDGRAQAIPAFNQSTQEQELLERAEKILNQITNEEQSPMEKAFSIYLWCGSNIQYVGHSDKTHWTTAASDALDSGTGDCYSYFSVAKALLTAAGIENLDIEKEGSGSRHYWSLINIGTGWYHMDCTPRRVPGRFFMNTDAELESYSQFNNGSHTFNSAAYPPRATTSVQHLVDYETGRIVEELCD